MKILSHRGYWKDPSEKNSQLAFERSQKLGFGTETDVRDYLEKLVISHDIPDSEKIEIRNFLKTFNSSDLPLAINIKSDGLAKSLAEVMAEFEISDWFVFDMSVPDAIAHLNEGNPVFSRASEYEKEVAFYEQAAGIWLDAFKSTWYDMELIRGWINDGKKVCVVSPDLHKREHLPLWETLRADKIVNSDLLMLCTDFPEDAENFFNQ